MNNRYSGWPLLVLAVAMVMFAMMPKPVHADTWGTVNQGAPGAYGGWYVQGVAGGVPIPVSTTGGGTSTVRTQAQNRSITTAVAIVTANTNVSHFMIQNVGTVVVVCKLGGTTGLTSTQYDVALKPGNVADDGNGGFWTVDGWNGAVSCLAPSGTGAASAVSY